MNTDLITRTLCILKPDAVRRGISGEVLARFERVGLKIVGIKMVQVSKNFAGNHYTYEDIAVRHGEDVRNNLIDFISSGPVIVFVLEGINAVEVVRKISGPTEPKAAPPGTIRGDYSHQSYEYVGTVHQTLRNVIHASASYPEAQREISLWFKPEELVEYLRNDEEEHCPTCVDQD